MENLQCKEGDVMTKKNCESYFVYVHEGEI